MKSIFKLLLLIAAASLTMTAVAGEKPRNGGGNGNGHGNSHQKYPHYQLWIRGTGGSTGSEYFSVDQACRTYPNSAGKVDVYGEIQINGYFLSESVQVYERYDGLDACPESNNVLSKDSSQTVTIRFGGLVVTADCTGQIMERGSDKTQLEYPGKRKQKTDLRSWGMSITDGADGACEMTVSDSDGNTETFGSDISTLLKVGYTSYY